MVFLKEFFEKVNFEKYQQMTKKSWKITQHAKWEYSFCKLLLLRSVMLIVIFKVDGFYLNHQSHQNKMTAKYQRLTVNICAVWSASLLFA